LPPLRNCWELTHVVYFENFDRASTDNTWAKLGFTGDIPDSPLALAEERFGPGITRMEQLMRLGRVGEQWSKEHGDTWDAIFSLEDRSYSMRMLSAWRSRIERKVES
jgi:hypothetical protein